MIDNIKQFFQSMWDATFSSLSGWYSSVAEFFSSAYDMFLFLVILALAFVIFTFLKKLTVPLIITSQIIMLTTIIASMLGFVALLATSFVSVYNKIYDLSGFITSGGDVSCLGHMFSCLSVNGILSTFFTELFSLFVLVILVKISGLFLWAFDVISDKVWRIGVLIGLV